MPKSSSQVLAEYRKAQEAAVARRVIQRTLNKQVELKYYAAADNTYGAISYNGTDFMQPFSQMAQGDTDSTRDGDRIFMKEFRFRVGVKIGSATPTFLRIICFQWHPTTVPVYANILLDQHNTACAPLSDFCHDTRQEYRILSDDLVQVDTVAHPAACVEHAIKSGFVPNVQFQAGSATVGTNHIYILAVSDVNLNGPQVVVYTKLLYTDS